MEEALMELGKIVLGGLAKAVQAVLSGGDIDDGLAAAAEHIADVQAERKFAKVSKP